MILSKNVTRKYNPDYAHLDEWEKIGTATLWHQDRQFDEMEYSPDDSYTQEVMAELNEPYARADVEQALRDQMRWSCSCEHDCCGHYFGGVQGEFSWVSPTLVKFTVGYARNH